MHTQQRLRIDQPCTQDSRPNASRDTVQPKQRSFEKRGRIYRSGSVAERDSAGSPLFSSSGRMINCRTFATYKGQRSVYIYALQSLLLALRMNMHPALHLARAAGNGGEEGEAAVQGEAGASA